MTDPKFIKDAFIQYVRNPEMIKTAEITATLSLIHI